MRSNRVLIISQDVVGPQMAGPGIRYWEFSRMLSREMAVTLAAPPPIPSADDQVDLLSFDADQPAPLREAVELADVVIASGYLLRPFPFLVGIETPLVIDAYIPYPLEVLELSREYSLTDRITSCADAVSTITLQFMSGDFFLCASERQRDLWLGLMLAQGRVNPQTYARDRTLRHLIDVVPFGLPRRPPYHKEEVLRGVHPAVGEGDRVILWGGGIWQWLDPLTLIQAMPRILEQRSDVRLFFPGTRHPHAREVPEMQMRQAAIELSDDLALTDRYVIFGDWMPYEDRQNYLLEADVGVSLHFDTLESRFAFRTRLLDYFWAGLPTVATEGDPLGDLVEQHDLGYVVEPEDVEGVASAILELLAVSDLRDAYRPRFKALAAQLTWPEVVKPLVRFCHEPKRALDRRSLGKSVCQAWIGELQREARRSMEAQVSHLEKHGRTLEEIIQARNGRIQTLERVIDARDEHVQALQSIVSRRDEQIAQLTQVIEEHSKRFPVRVYRALKKLWGTQR